MDTFDGTTFESTLTPGEAEAIVDYDELRIKIVGPVDLGDLLRRTLSAALEDPHGPLT